MKKLAAAAAVLAASVMVATPALAQSCWEAKAVDATKLRGLDLMLMVTSLRCRMGPDDFQRDYARFVESHRAELSAANHVIRERFAAGGSRAADNAIDKMSVTIANSYGTGHPDLGCRELRRVTRDLATNHTSGGLLEAANALVRTPAVAVSACPARIAAARR